MKKIITLLTLIFLFSCNTQKTYPKWRMYNSVTNTGDNYILAIIKRKDGTKYPSEVLARIMRYAKYDSVQNKATMVVDTLYGYPSNKYIIDSITNKPLLDSLGAPRIDPKSPYLYIGKDSVQWKNIEGVPLEILLAPDSTKKK